MHAFFRSLMCLRGTLAVVLTAALTAAGVTLTMSLTVNVDVNTPPVPAESLGWAGPEEVAKAAPIVAGMPPFEIVDENGRRIVQDNLRANVRLWEAEVQVYGGFLPNVPQETGDCVSFGMARAVEIVQCVQIAREGSGAELKLVDRPAIYGGSRVTIGGGRLRGAGSVGAWAAEWVQKHGVLRQDFPGVPPYSGRRADEWGRRGVPQEFLAELREHPVKTVSQVRNVNDLRDAVCNGYPVTIASDFGTRTIRERDGRMVAKWDSSWMHQMCIDGYDGSLGPGREYFHVANSWGTNAHPQPIDGSPPGGFWITADDADRIVRQGDSFAVSLFTGFRAQDLDFRVFGQTNAGGRGPRSAAKLRAVARIDRSKEMAL